MRPGYTNYVSNFDFSDERRAEAQHKGQLARKEAAELKHELSDGKISLSDATLDYRTHNIRLFDLLVCYPRLGETKAQLAMMGARINPNKKCRAVTMQEMRRLILSLRTMGIEAE